VVIVKDEPVELLFLTSVCSTFVEGHIFLEDHIQARDFSVAWRIQEKPPWSMWVDTHQNAWLGHWIPACHSRLRHWSLFLIT